VNSIRLRERVAELQEAIRAAALASGALEVRVFGSVARGDEVEHSDIDFLVTLEPGRTLLDLARLEVRLEQLLGRRVDVVTIEGLREPMRSAALREAVRV
jgi:predicted nucleotidyltransferase